MAITTRSYGQACSAARALDVVGERWALLVVRELLLGPKRFTDLRAGLPNASSNVLSQRLRELKRAGVVRLRRLPPPAGSSVYELTEWGKGLERVLVDLARWGGHSPVVDPAAAASVDALMLLIRSHFDPTSAVGLDASYTFRIGEEYFAVDVAGGQITIMPGEAHEADAVIEAGARTLVAVLTRRQRLSEAVADNQLEVAGNIEAVEQLLQSIVIPSPEYVSTM